MEKENIGQVKIDLGAFKLFNKFENEKEKIFVEAMNTNGATPIRISHRLKKIYEFLKSKDYVKRKECYGIFFLICSNEKKKVNPYKLLLEGVKRSRQGYYDDIDIFSNVICVINKGESIKYIKADACYEPNRKINN